MAARGENRKIAIAGAGPAGSSLAIRLARAGFEVTLIEREKFPRHKLCGEFISPECLRHFADLGALDEMLAAGGERIYETRFYDRGGRSFTVPSSLLDDRGFGLSLSRARMDNILMSHAIKAGVAVLEGHRISDALVTRRFIKNLSAAGEKGELKIDADLFVDATGRSSVLSKIVERKLPDKRKKAPQQPLAVGFKAHVSGARIEPGVCEIFSFRAGYGGLTPVEDGLANLCFMIAPRAARRRGSDAVRLVREAVCRNPRAAHLLENAEPVQDWLAVSVNHYGRSTPAAAENLFTVGDAAAFIDPFTGSGMLMAMESSALLASTIGAEPSSASAIRDSYHRSFERTFSKRLRVCAFLRRAAFAPMLPTLVVAFFNMSERGRSYLTSAVRTRKTARSKIV